MSRCPSARCVLACAARAVIAALLALPAAACSDDGVGPAGQAQEELIFLSNRDGGITPSGQPRHDIYRMRADGTGLQNLTRHPATYRYLSLSPDGRRLVFQSDRSGSDIWVMNVDGTGLARLTRRDSEEEEGNNLEPQWSPDGTRIAFTSNRERRTNGGASGLYDVYVMDADGRNPRNVSLSLGDELGFDVRLSGWSPGGQVVFESTDVIGGAWHHRVYLVNEDGSGLRALFPGGVDHSPAWSPDGSRVAFISRRDGGEWLYVMNADGSDARPLTSANRLPGWSNDGREMAYTPWSPDGTRIAFQRWDNVFTWGTLHVIGVDGAEPLQLTAEITTFNGWSPRGDRIAFTSRRGGSSDVYSIHPGGGDHVNLTSQLSADLYDERNALWLPRR
jgi:Tol biopolymer transport system component